MTTQPSLIPRLLYSCSIANFRVCGPYKSLLLLHSHLLFFLSHTQLSTSSQSIKSIDNQQSTTDNQVIKSFADEMSSNNTSGTDQQPQQPQQSQLTQQQFPRIVLTVNGVCTSNTCIIASFKYFLKLHLTKLQRRPPFRPLPATQQPPSPQNPAPNANSNDGQSTVHIRGGTVPSRAHTPRRSRQQVIDITPTPNPKPGKKLLRLGNGVSLWVYA